MITAWHLMISARAEPGRLDEAIQVPPSPLTCGPFYSGRFTTFKLRARNASCAVCGTAPAITRANQASFDYFAFTGQVCS